MYTYVMNSFCFHVYESHKILFKGEQIPGIIETLKNIWSLSEQTPILTAQESYGSQS